MIRFAIFFILFYLYLWLRIDPGLLYHGHGMVPFPVFYRGEEFFRGFLFYPGGLTKYISALLYQFFYFPPLGSLIITVVAAAICLATGKFITAMGNTRFRAVIYVPAILILMVYNQYYHCLPANLGLLVSLFFLWIYLMRARLGAVPRVAVFLVSSAILYYAAGGAYLLYAALCAIYEFLPRRKPLVGLLFIISALLIPYIASVYIFKFSFIDGYARVLPFHPESYSRFSNAVWVLYIFFPVAALWISLWHRFALSPGRRQATGYQSESWLLTPSPGTNVTENNRIDQRKFLYETLVMLLIACATVFFPIDRDRKTLLRINYFSRQEMWDRVLDESRRLPSETYYLLVNHDVNTALYHTGRFPCEMFSFPQNPKALITLNFGLGSQGNIFADAELPRISENFFRLGLLNNAEHTAYEAMELIGEYPEILQQLFYINIVKGYTETARVYLCTLSKDLIFGKWAESTLRLLDEDPLMSTDKTVQYVRSIMSAKDHVGFYKNEDILLDLLQNNKRNRMAFEYLMAHYLFSFQFDKIVQNIHRLDDFGYPDIPSLYEEAILIFTKQTGDKVDLHGRKISKDTSQRFSEFINHATLYSQNKNKEAVFDVLVRDFGDSYFFYCMFGCSGLKK